MLAGVATGSGKSPDHNVNSGRSLSKKQHKIVDQPLLTKLSIFRCNLVDDFG